ncbi:MAG: hypothetical protein FJ271_11195 [Planctomycetes bacterium]|nr:hypothetical protein [Planctomycetota bacterium]
MALTVQGVMDRQFVAARILPILASLVLVADALAIDPGRVAVGDSVYVAVDGAELHVNGKPAARLQRKTEMRVLEVRDQWLGGAVVIDGAEKKGWLELAKVFKADDAGALARLKGGALMLDRDFSGNVLEATAAKPALSPGDLAALRGLYSLETLDLSETTIVDDDLKTLRGLTNLRRLYLARTVITAHGLDPLSSLSRLEVLALGHTRVTGAGLTRLGKLPHLQVLNLSGCRIDDDDLAHLERFPGLRVLALDGTLVRGRGLRHLQNLRQLNLLNLNGCKLMNNAILSLRGLDDLRALYLDQAALDNATEGQLNRLLPQLAIIKRGSR